MSLGFVCDVFEVMAQVDRCLTKVNPVDQIIRVWLKTLLKKLADKVNAPGDTPEARLGVVEDRVDEVALHGVCLGTTLGLAAMATKTGIDYSTRPRGFHGGAPEDIDDIEVILERLC
jgi:hypothetical protein